ncbi:hypothetical protein CKO22_11610 [Thiococcus pfennigii]|nr:hypothetical protein [Thiococcus pfennigii]
MPGACEREPAQRLEEGRLVVEGRLQVRGQQGQLTAGLRGHRGDGPRGGPDRRATHRPGVLAEHAVNEVRLRGRRVEVSHL